MNFELVKFNFEDLEVWKKSVEFANAVINLIDRNIAVRKHFRLVEQLEAAVISPALNIAEGKGRQSKKEFIQFLYISEGSLFEVLTLTELFKRNELITLAEAQMIRSKAEIIDRKLHGLINSLKQRAYSK